MRRVVQVQWLTVTIDTVDDKQAFQSQRRELLVPYFLNSNNSIDLWTTSMCRISAKPSQFALSVEAGLLPNYTKPSQSKNSDITAASPHLLPSSSCDSNELTVESSQSSSLVSPAAESVRHQEEFGLPVSTRVYQTAVVEPFHPPSIHLIFRATRHYDLESNTSLSPMSWEFSYNNMCHNDNHVSTKRGQVKKCDDCATRYVYKTPPSSPGRKLLDPPPTPKLHKILADFTQNENTTTLSDLFLPIILT